MNGGKPYVKINAFAILDGTLQAIFWFVMVWMVWALSASASDKALQEDLSYRKDRTAWMRSERSPLALAGLFWLKPGRNSFGTDSSNDFVLPAGSAAGRVGFFELKGNTASVGIEGGTSAKLNGRTIGQRVELKSDASGTAPDILELNHLRMRVIQRGGKLARMLSHHTGQLGMRRIRHKAHDSSGRISTTGQPGQVFTIRSASSRSATSISA